MSNLVCKRPYHPAQLAAILQLPQFLAPRTEEFGDCLLWTRSCVGLTPVASVKLADGSRPSAPVRRTLWGLLYGAPPPTMDVITRCGSPKCVEPRHFKLASRKVSCQRAAAQGRLQSPTRAASQRKAMAHRKDRLGESGAAQVRRMLVEGIRPAAVAVTMGVSLKSIQRIASNRSYPPSNTWRAMVDILLAFPETSR